jgi:hypothetical protein
VPGEDPPRPRLLVLAVRAEHHELRPLVGLLVLDAALVGRQCADDSVEQAGVVPLPAMDLDRLVGGGELHVGRRNADIDQLAHARLAASTSSTSVTV